MIDPEKRKAIYYLHKEGMGVREISRRLSVNTNTVSTIIAQKGILVQITRKDKIRIDEQLVRSHRPFA